MYYIADCYIAYHVRVFELFPGPYELISAFQRWIDRNMFHADEIVIGATS